MRKLFHGDNLQVLRDFIPDDTVALVYLDPPFNSNRDYRVSVHARANGNGDRSRAGKARTAAFADTWEWNDEAEQDFAEALKRGDPPVAAALRGLAGMLGEGGMMAYLAMMAVRLLELRRVLKPTGSLYLHCDASAGHYLKVLLDAVFGARNFRNEIVWHYYNKFSAGRRIFPRCYDQILFYTMGERYTFNPLREPRERPVRQLVRENVGGVLKNRKDKAGKTITRVVHDRKVDAVWRIPCLQFASREFLGYPTQKPLALLERIVRASSNPGDVVLDPFCGCGTAVHAAEKLGRGWIGIDRARLAIDLVHGRLAEAFPPIAIETHPLPPQATQAAAIPAAARNRR